MRRIAVIGSGGGGKSTLPRALGERLGLPALDAWIIDSSGPCRSSWSGSIVRTPSSTSTFRPARISGGRRSVNSSPRVRGRAWAGQSSAPPSRLLFNTLRRVDRVRPALYETVTKDGRATKLVQLRSPRAMREWLDRIRATRTSA